VGKLIILKWRKELKQSVDNQSKINYLYIKIFNLNEIDSKTNTRIYSNKYLQMIEQEERSR